MRKAARKSDQEVLPPCSPLAQLSKMFLINSSMISRLLIYLRVNTFNLLGKVPLPILKELEHQARQNISTLNFTATFAKTSSSCKPTLQKCQHSMKSTFKRVKSHIQKGANPENAAKHRYQQACEYLDIWNKTVLIQHRPVTCLSKSLVHILQSVLYSKGNTGLQSKARSRNDPFTSTSRGMRHQELRNSPFWHSSLFKFQLAKEGEDIFT